MFYIFSSLVACFILYAFLFADETSGISRFANITLPDTIGTQLRKILTEASINKLSFANDYFLVAVYLVIVLGSWSIVFTHLYPFITESSHVSSWHKYSAVGVFFLCGTSWRNVSVTNPGYITEKTMAKFDNYPYDDIIFVNKECPTLGIRKLPRSKYDRYTGRHIARFDHYCGWIHNSVGEENHRHFFFFIFVQLGMCVYGALLTAKLFWGEIQDKNLLGATFFNGKTGEKVPADPMVVFHYLMMKHFPVACVFIMMAVMSVALGLFFGFHLYIASRGMTTNEYYKWKMVKKWHEEQKSNYLKAHKGDKITPMISNCSESITTEILQLADVDIGCTGPSQIIHTFQERCDDEIFDPGPMPVNIYNLGIIQNYQEILFPKSKRKGALERWGKDWEKRTKRIEQKIMEKIPKQD